MNSTSKRTYGACLALTLVLVQFGALRLSPSASVVRVVLPLTIAAVPVALWPYRRRLGTCIMFVGLAANLAVILANGGLMPIERSTIVSAIGAERAATYRTGAWVPGSKDVLVAAGGGRAIALGDSIRIGSGRRGLVASPGDIVVWAGLLVLAAEASVAWQRDRRREQNLTNEARADRTAEGGATTVWRATPPPSGDPR